MQGSARPSSAHINGTPGRRQLPDNLSAREATPLYLESVVRRLCASFDRVHPGPLRAGPISPAMRLMSFGASVHVTNKSHSNRACDCLQSHLPRLPYILDGQRPRTTFDDAQLPHHRKVAAEIVRTAAIQNHHHGIPVTIPPFVRGDDDLLCRQQIHTANCSLRSARTHTARRLVLMSNSAHPPNGHRRNRIEGQSGSVRPASSARSGGTWRRHRLTSAFPASFVFYKASRHRREDAYAPSERLSKCIVARLRTRRKSERLWVPPDWDLRAARRIQ
ncbi:hypothetical protein FB567DRAFT_154014 [Paraphoma chrysanthemicola]|uniref:Uncharacterized protein n=1 Tax=Paraphoma chrysanthemicola TaxID=798071 RepID=A0A8K0QXI5_9PLEO|nr:hypothetical protein FB567DRAFT_154014 [Paraphoma chrysanthemicola]